MHKKTILLDSLSVMSEISICTYAYMYVCKHREIKFEAIIKQLIEVVFLQAVGKAEKLEWETKANLREDGSKIQVNLAPKIMLFTINQYWLPLYKGKKEKEYLSMYKRKVAAETE